ncbi:MAG: DUF4405 domain-containing protein [Campylobacterales bacterium]|nr:DUF4405 domain-containing protein [Campylobacterales bacterium]
MKSLRRFASLTLAFSFFMESYTGIFLFIAPKTRVATATNWEIWGLTKSQYADLHITFMIVFLLSALLHLYFNWGLLVAYFKNKARTFSLGTKEFLFAFGINALFVIGTLYHVPPLQTFLEWGEGIRKSWGVSTVLVPLNTRTTSTSTTSVPTTQSSRGGYGRLSLEEAAKQADINAEEALAFVAQKGFKATPQSNLKEIAEALHTTPLEFMELLKQQKK